MDKLDRENLQFILSTTGPALEMWYNSLTEDQKLYATRLLDVYKQELVRKAILASDAPITDFSDAKKILRNFTLGN